MGMGQKADTKWKNFISLWERNSGALAASGELNFEAMCKVMVDQEQWTRDQAKKIYLALKEACPELKMQLACWTVKDRSGKQPNFQLGWNPPYDKQGSPGGSDESFNATQDDVPF